MNENGDKLTRIFLFIYWNPWFGRLLAQKAENSKRVPCVTTKFLNCVSWRKWKNLVTSQIYSEEALERGETINGAPWNDTDLQTRSKTWRNVHSSLNSQNSLLQKSIVACCFYFNRKSLSYLQSRRWWNLYKPKFLIFMPSTSLVLLFPMPVH